MELRSRPWLVFFAAAQNKFLAQTHRPREGLQVMPVDEAGALDGEPALRQLGKAAKQFVRNHELEHRIAEELEPLVIRQPLALFVAEGSVGERLSQELGPGEAMAHARLEIVEAHAGLASAD